MSRRVNAYLDLPFSVKREGKWFVSCIPVLDVHSQGPTRAKALSNLVEAVQLFLASCYARGTLDQVLRDSGFRPSNIADRVPQTRSGRARTIEVPLPFTVRTERGGSGCRA